MVIAALLAVPVAAIAPLQAEPVGSLVLFGIALFLANVAASVGPAATMEMVPPRMRGVASALGVLIVNVIGLGGGPLLIGLSTDYLFADELMLDRSLALLLPIMMALSGVFALCCLRPYSAVIMSRSEAA
jgi:MFS family permease